MEEIIYHQWSEHQTRSGLIPSVHPYDAIARRIADGVTLPTRSAASIALPVLTKAERIEKAKQEAKDYLSDPDVDPDHLAVTLSLRHKITKQEAAGLVEEVRKQIEEAV